MDLIDANPRVEVIGLLAEAYDAAGQPELAIEIRDGGGPTEQR